ncbi:MAG: 16S rRNA (guanine(966)-N(2))-methyltransferase RsmD [Candidatus Hydrogenedentes bacterium]|nr:16S rRNA (guanine(966)-N(2))-methyltransferase RsmD [Candidatus Hydrogenedentota bacterium]
MRIIAGTARGVRLASPPDQEIRPTLDRIRESLFNIIAPEVPGGRFLDLFAGTGANGLEALSRGAGEVTFVDDTSRALELVRENLRRTRLTGRVTCLQLKLPQGIRRLNGPFDIIFADPPYRYGAYLELLETIGSLKLLAPQGMTIVEHDRKSAIPPSAGTLKQFRQKRYGDTVLSFFSA